MAAKKKNLGGRPALFKTVKELETKIDKYFKECPDKRMVKVKDSEGAEYHDYLPCPTVTGLALYLGFCDRQSMYDYQEKQEFTCTIKRARTFIENEYEKMLHNGQCTGAIFALKNMGWKDRIEQEITNTNLNIESNIDKAKELKKLLDKNE